MKASDVSTKLREIRSTAAGDIVAFADSILRDAELHHWFERRVREREEALPPTLAPIAPAGIRTADMQVTWDRAIQLTPELLNLFP